MQVVVLGSIEVNAERPIALGGPTQRRLLGLLALHHDDVVSLDRMVDATWTDDRPAAQSERNVRSYVHRLRTALDGVGSRIETVGAGYRLHLEPGELDLERFDALAATARRHAEAGDTAAALDAVREALTLWRGVPFGEFADEPWAVADATRAAEARAGLRELRAELLIEDGRPSDSIPDLVALIDEHPYRERPRALLMQALYHAGRQPEALRAFRDFRGLLVDEVGVEPSHDLVELDRRIATGTLAATDDDHRRTVGAYVIGERIGEGAFAVVYRATQESLQRDVAMKVVRAELANRPEFVRRFEAEAQMVARIEHPNVVPLYDYWRQPDRAYLVMRLMTGGTLEARLDGGPLAVDVAVAIVSQIADALTAAHDLGVVHRDVKPENVMFDEEGRAYLADFGIALGAAERAHPEAALSEGSPLYASPEQLRRQPVGPEADVHALAAVTFTMLTGHAPFADAPDEAELLRRQLHEAIPSVRDRRPEIPAAVDRVLRIATAEEPRDRYPTATAFALALGAAITSSPDAPPQVRRRERSNPYKGLRAFDETDAHDFRGRERLVDELMAAVADGDERMLAVVGPSGSGKSSVVRAGLVPALRAGRLPGSAGWFVTTMTPGRDPYESLETALLRIAVNPPGSLLEQLASDRRGILRAVRRILPDDGTTALVLIDQFEELFTHGDEPARRDRFLDALVTASSEPASPLRVVLTLRADFFDRPLRHPALAAVLRRRTVTVAPLAPDELERAIVDPAAAVGVEFEPGVVARIVADVASQPGALPLLQFALTRMFDQADGDVIRDADYEAIGGIAGSVARRADELWEDSSAEERPAARATFERLVTLGEGVQDTRRRVERAELGDDPATAAVLDRYGRARLLTFDHDPASREPTVEVAHEALIQQWPRLREWLDDDRDALRAHRHLTAAAAGWVERDRDPAELYRGARLETAEELSAAPGLPLNADERAFVRAGVEQRNSEARERHRRTVRLRRLAVAAVGLAVVALIAGAVAVVQRDEAEDSRILAERRTVESDMQRLTTEARAALAEDPDLAILLALEAGERARQLGGELPGDVIAALQSTTQDSRLVGVLDDGQHARFSPDGSRLLTVGRDAPTEIVVRDASTLAEIERFRAGGRIEGFELSPDGSILAVWYVSTVAAPPVRLFETDGFTPVAELEVDSGPGGGDLEIIGPVEDSLDADPPGLVDEETLLRSDCCIYDVWFSADGAHLAGSIGSVDMPPVTALWDLAEPSAEPMVFPEEEPGGFLPESGDLVLIRTTDTPHSVRLVDPEDGETSGTIGPESGLLGDSDAGGLLSDTHPVRDEWATFVDASEIQVWTPGADEPQATFRAGGIVSGVTYSARGDRLLVHGDDDQVLVIDRSSGATRSLRGHAGGVWSLSTNLAGDRLLTSQVGGGIRVWDLSATGPPELGNLAVGPVPVGGLTATAEGDALAVVERGAGGWRAQLRDRVTGDALSSFPAGNDVPPALSTDGTLVAEGGPSVRIRDVATGRVTAEDAGCGAPLAVDDTGRWVVVGQYGCDGTSSFGLIDVESGSWIRTLPPIFRAEFGPAGSAADGLLAVSVNLENLELYDVRTGEFVSGFDMPRPGGFWPRFTADGRLLSIGSQLGGAFVFDVERVLAGTAMADAIVANPVVEGSPTAFSIVAGDHLVTTHGGEVMRFWDLETGELWLEMPITPDRVPTLAVDADATDLYYGGEPGVINRFPLQPDVLVDLARQRVQRDFTSEECARYDLGDGCSAFD